MATVLWLCVSFGHQAGLCYVETGEKGRVGQTSLLLLILLILQTLHFPFSALPWQQIPAFCGQTLT